MYLLFIVCHCEYIGICFFKSYSNALGWCAFFLCLYSSIGFPQIEEAARPFQRIIGG